MEISAKVVMKLRAKTGVGMMDCKKALKSCDGDFDKAIDYLREKGISKAASKADRSTKEGLVYSYIHTNGKLGVLVEVNCETDFVAKTDDFKTLCKDIAMHIAATNPLCIKKEDIDSNLIEKESQIYRKRAINDGKKEAIVERIVEGQISKFISQNTLLEQEFVKDPDKKVKAVITEAVAKLGENIQVNRFARFAIGNL